MKSKYSKLELVWPNKDKDEKLEPRVLIEDPDKSYGEKNTENMLIHADNLLALKALEQKFSNKIKCIYIDPPFNTGNAFEHYDDGLEHTLWLELISRRLKILHQLLSNDGSIYVHIDNNEQAYLKLVLDEIFGRKNFVQMISVKRASPAGFKVINPGPLTVTDYIMLYAKNKDSFSYYPQRIPVNYDENYDLYIENIYEEPNKWRLSKLVDILYKQYNFQSWKDAKSAWGSNWKVVRNSLLGDLAIQMKDVVVSVRDPHKPSDRIKELMNESKKSTNQIFVLERDNYSPIYIYNGGSLSFYKEKLREINGVLTPTELLTDFWSDLNFAGIAKEGNVQFKNSKKPEMLVKRILELSTQKGDWVLDSFLGSGTTAAVAHKMGRKWIGIELGEHCTTHCLPRLQAVCDGTDQGGISKSMDWQGGGGFKYYQLAPSLLNKDKHNQWVINPNYNAQLLAAAVARHEGFIYCPSESVIWKQGFATENHYIFTTTHTITSNVVEHILSEMNPDESLRICCSAFDDNCDSISDRIEIKKIPGLILNRCEFGNEDYCTSIVNMPSDPDKPAFVPSYVKPEVKPSPAKISKEHPNQAKLLF